MFSNDPADFVVNDPSPKIVKTKLPFSKGVNFNGWFERPSPRSIPFTMYTEQDFINVKSMGVDHIRVPMNPHAMTGGAPDYILDPLFLDLLDKAVDMAERQKIYIILDNHSFHSIIPTAPDIDKILIPVWEQLAGRYKTRSEYVLYEVLNEPHGIDAALWADIQGRAVDAIRAIDSEHYIIAGGVDYNNMNALFELPKYPYKNIIYTFHFYAPFYFTHQGETWSGPPTLRQIREVPFPAGIRSLPELPPELKGTWPDDYHKKYEQDGKVEAMAELLDRAVKFSADSGDVPLYCGEFGAFQLTSLPEDRERWYKTACTLLNNRGICYTNWGYFVGFGIFNRSRGGEFDRDLNVGITRALGFTPPEQKPVEDFKSGFAVFDNYPDLYADFLHWDSEIDFFFPGDNKNLLAWTNKENHGVFFFTFRRGIDWEYLCSNNYAVTFRAKASKQNTFDVRFQNYESAASIPWRMGKSVSVPADNNWHIIRVPLNEMTEQETYANLTKSERAPEGKFSWSNIERLAFAGSPGSTGSSPVIFDYIRIE